MGKYLPDSVNKDIDVLEYSNSIIDKIMEDDNPESYVKVLGLMARKNLMDLVKMDKYDRTSLFMECLVENRVWVLKDYMRKIGYGTSNR